jgi:hypothetical protein
VCGAFTTGCVPISRDINGRERVFLILHCRNCDARFDQRVGSVEESENEESQILAAEESYRPCLNEREYQELLLVNQTMVGGFTRFFRVRDVYVEIGVGLGVLARAAASIFGKVYGLDLDVDAARTVAPVPDNVEFRQHQDFVNHVDCEISALCAWHVIEHLPHPHDVLARLVERMTPVAVAFGQVPLFKPEYVYDVHYVFYTETSLIVLFRTHGLTPVLLERDEANQFLTYCFRKS